MIFFAPIFSALIENATSQADQVKMKADVETRFRFERRTDRDFFGPNHDNRSEFLTRIRPGITATLKNATVRIQGQYAHSQVWTERRNFSIENVDASQAYVSFALGKEKLTVGRQKIALGDERLIGPLEWANVARAMDGVRYQAPGGLDVFAFRLDQNVTFVPNVFVAGVSKDFSFGKLSYLYKEDETAAGDTRVHTLNHLWKGKVGQKTKAEVEWAAQTGEVGPRDLDAYAGHFRLTHDLSRKTTIWLEYNFASGGQSGNHSKTFDNLYPTNHKFYGSMDLLGWKNMQELSLQIHQKVGRQSTLKLAYHAFSLFDASDAWYGAGGGANNGPSGAFRDATGNSGKSLGNEIDLEFSQVINPQSSVALGVAFFDPGNFIKNRNGLGTRKQWWGYGMVSIKF
ncbi:MAG: alginate export family protein [Fimbriimonadaceae bacterium]|jgi:hypothetical protein|nr:alginate export family protein [Fimbriimonadaceae bacterium]